MSNYPDDKLYILLDIASSRGRLDIVEDEIYLNIK